jgi:hypothetical protein
MAELSKTARASLMIFGYLCGVIANILALLWAR